MVISFHELGCIFISNSAAAPMLSIQYSAQYGTKIRSGMSHMLTASIWLLLNVTFLPAYMEGRFGWCCSWSGCGSKPRYLQIFCEGSEMGP